MGWRGEKQEEAQRNQRRGTKEEEKTKAKVEGGDGKEAETEAEEDGKRCLL